MTGIFPSQERLVRNEVALGFIRELAFPEDHIWPSLLGGGLKGVDSDDVIFQYVQEVGTGLAPARAEDAEAEMAYKEEQFGTGSASMIDWSLKDHYQTSDVSRYRDTEFVQAQLGGLGSALPLSVTGGYTDAFNARIARDTVLRRRKLDNRLEWLAMQMLWLNTIVYAENKVPFTVVGNRPSQQTAVSVTPWDTADGDPIGDLLLQQQFMQDTHHIFLTRAIASRKIITRIMNSKKFAALSGLVMPPLPSGGTASPTPIDPFYAIPGWGWERALAIIEAQTNIKFQMYDSVYRTKTRGDNGPLINHRFSPHDQVLLLPDDAAVQAFAVDDIGFGKMMSSPHVAGGWTPGFYAWEKDHGQDPWSYDIGSGVKAFPVMPHLDLTVTLKVLSAGQ